MLLFFITASVIGVDVAYSVLLLTAVKCSDYATDAGRLTPHGIRLASAVMSLYVVFSI